MFKFRNYVGNELWGHMGKKGTWNIIYSLTPVQEDGTPATPQDARPKLCCFSVESVGKHETVGYLFNNRACTHKCWEGDEPKANRQTWEALRDYAEQEPFVLTNSGTFVKARTSHKEFYLRDLLYALYNGVTVEEAKDMGTYAFFPWIVWDDYEFPVYTLECGYILMQGGHKRIVCRDNYEVILTSFLAPMPLASRYSMAFRYVAFADNAPNDLKLYHPEDCMKECRDFFFDYDKELADLLIQFNSWSLSYSNDALRINIGGIDIPFAEIVSARYSGRLDLTDMDSFKRTVLENHRRMSEQGLCVDHLTHDTRNNFSWALAEVPYELNNQAQIRDRIKPPYYFFTVRDTEHDLYKLKFGVYGQWERRVVFRDLACKTADGEFLYAKILNKFKKIIGANCSLKITEGSYLQRWGSPYNVCPEFGKQKDNPLLAMVKQPLLDYADAGEALAEDAAAGEPWLDMPVL